MTKKPYVKPVLKDITFRDENWRQNMMNATPDNEAALEAFEVDIMEVILKHRANDGISALNVGATLVNILFVMGTTQADPKVAVEQMKEALDGVYNTWLEVKKPDVLKGMIERCLMAKGRIQSKKCSQKDCPNDGAFLFTWPGKDEDSICTEHLPKLKQVVEALGFHLQITPIGKVAEDEA